MSRDEKEETARAYDCIQAIREILGKSPLPMRVRGEEPLELDETQASYCDDESCPDSFGWHCD